MNRPKGRELRVVLVVLLVAGWATNHFAAVIPVLRETEHLSATVLAGAFGVYALGLLPGLLGGGALSDRIGRRSVVLTGSVVAAAGNGLMLAWHPAAGVYTGRLVVGVGVGLAISGGTAWAADLGGARGTTVAGATLTAGFACGPLVSGIVAEAVPSGAAVTAPFAVAIALSAGAVLLAVVRTTPAAPPTHAPAPTPAAGAPATVERSIGRALVRSVPMALWVFSAVTVPVVVLASRLGGDLSGPLVPGLASALALGTGVAVQVAARRAGWGPRAGVVGALLAAAGFAVAARVDAHPGVALFVVTSVVLGSAYGLCLRAGLVDVERLTPPEHRGVTVGIYYVCTYLGFGLPVLLEALRAGVGTTAPLLVLTGLALAAALLRAFQLRPDPSHLR
ncbi:MFS transporter [Nocardioides aromaticivorans]|uniref:MFS transporter n=1 Tax=Nocardioides aromaticivorans TaxID=200618 RepID=A0ABX7PF15_9ACTN|nr:MFS transporter [Nocardioides aromaticivorans]QSR24470.1 MFS transporter [Nocardioides aromaticivorans]